MRDFTPQRLEKLYHTVTNYSQKVFWRHDIDYSLDAALDMAEWEYDRGIRSTYYLFSECEHYGYHDSVLVEAQLFDLGHDIGSHVDERICDFRALRGKVSFHMPTENVLWKDFQRFKNAYAKRWKGFYVADSGGKFRYGDPEDLIPKKNGNWQVNLHPEWWFGTEDEKTALLAIAEEVSR